jgi:glycosyltransferase involved in cell wall biosynthesis
MHGREALMVPCGDRDALANGLVRLLDDAPLREKLGETGRARSLEYDWQHVTGTVLDVYEETLGPVRVPVPA